MKEQKKLSKAMRRFYQFGGYFMVITAPLCWVVLIVFVDVRDGLSEFEKKLLLQLIFLSIFSAGWGRHYLHLYRTGKE